MIYIIILLISYLLGSIPMGLVLTKMAGKGDLRKVGSGNIGATNVMRVGGLRMAALAWLLDMLKVILPVVIGWAYANVGFGAWCGFVAIVGHCFPIWLRFRGGKGVSGLFGMILAISPLSFVFIGIEWLIVALTSGYSSLGALVVFVLAAHFWRRLFCAWCGIGQISFALLKVKNRALNGNGKNNKKRTFLVRFLFVLYFYRILWYNTLNCTEGSFYYETFGHAVNCVSYSVVIR